MKAVVLAGGEGTRLKPLTYKRPKPLMPVAGRPCIDYVLRSLAASGFHEIIVTTAYLSDALIKSIGDGLDYNASILYSFEENPAGTAGAVRRVANFIDETFVVAMGDILCDVDFKALFEFHKRTGGVVTIALTDVDDPTQYGIVGLDAKGRIQKFKEKPRKEEAFSSLVNAGI
ncbi:MAG: nucleotidyltransferase family protein, partial [Methanobacteriota archaeon]